MKDKTSGDGSTWNKMRHKSERLSKAERKQAKQARQYRQSGKHWSIT
jgi:hypothetical protein